VRPLLLARADIQACVVAGNIYFLPMLNASLAAVLLYMTSQAILGLRYVLGLTWHSPLTSTGREQDIRCLA
jgi:hypothetical protein